MQRLPRPRQTVMKNGVPEIELQEHGNVLEHFNIGGSKAGKQPVARKPGNAHHRPQDDGHDDPHQGDLEGIQHADEQCPGVAVGGRIGNQGLTDFEPGLPPDETEAGGDGLPAQIGLSDGKKIVSEGQHQAQGQDLVDQRPFGGVMPERDTFYLGRSCWFRVHVCHSSVGLSANRFSALCDLILPSRGASTTWQHYSSASGGQSPPYVAPAWIGGRVGCAHRYSARSSGHPLLDHGDQYGAAT